MAKKTASPKKVVPKKVAKPLAKTVAKPVAKSVAKKTAPAKEKPAAVKVATAKAEPKAPAPKKVAAPAPVVIAAPVKSPAKKQVTENTEKIKIDREAMTEEQIKWAEMYNKFKDTQATSYDMKSSFKAGAPILHKILGWGWVVSNDNDRLEVLFKDGKRVLISNYRG